MQLHSIKAFPKSRKTVKRVGRGLGSSHGTYSTRGMKGQRSRSGGSKGLKLKGMKQMLLRIPKVRGFKSIHAKAIVVNLQDLEKMFQKGDVVNRETLVAKKLINLSNNGKEQAVKILGSGKVSKDLFVEGLTVSQSAKEKIEKAGGSVK